MRIRYLAGLCLGLALSACDRADAPPSANDAGAGTPAAYAKEVTALKAKGMDPAATLSALRDLRHRFGFPVAGEGTAAPFSEIAAEPALAKEAAIGPVWKNVKQFAMTFPTAIKQSFVISNAGTLHAWTAGSAVEQGVDPVLIAYYRTSGGTGAHTVKVVAYNDDIASDNLGSDIVWTNNTGANVTVEVLAFVYSPEAAGTIKLFVRHSIFPITNTYTSVISAAPLWNNTAVATGIGGCTGPWKSRIRLSKTAGGGFGHGLLGINYNTMTGGQILENSATLELGSVIPSGAYSMLLGYVPWDITKSEDGTKYSAFQDNRYDCFQ